MRSSIFTGFTQWIEDKINELSEEYYGHPQPDPKELYLYDLDFRHWVNEVWSEASYALDARNESIY